MQEPFEVLEHTADVALRCHGATRAELYANAAAGMLSLITERETVRPTEEETLEVAGADAIDLLVRWLHEVLFRCQARGRIYREAVVTDITDTHLAAKLKGEAFDPNRHPSGSEIKAVTYHGCRVEKVDGGWMAEVIFDV